jgi:methylenetetrahydrofolate dehydrogenase (NADP+)/methenyltetrahydrofolate cyclohydrolase
MTQAALIDGKATARTLRAAVGRHVDLLVQKHDLTPGLAVILVGDDPASAIYVGSKEKMARQVGIRGATHHLPHDTPQDTLLKLVEQLNADLDVHGILIQLPLPPHIDTDLVTQTINPAKDVDGLHIENIGRLVSGLPGLAPCTPTGCVMLAKSVRQNLGGLHAVVVGRSNLVGKPVAQMLLRENCTVTICHSRTPDLPSFTRQADILIAAAGRPQMIKGDWIKPGAIVIDVGITRSGNGIVGDVAFDEALRTAGHITPVPGGVGPMTIACLLWNTVTAACRQQGLAPFVPERETAA